MEIERQSGKEEEGMKSRVAWVWKAGMEMHKEAA